MSEEEVDDLTPEQLELATILLEKERECNLTLNVSSELQSLYCPGVFDGWVCWPDTVAGESASHPCPGFIVGFDPERTAYRKCEENGEWFFHTVFNKTWSNYTTCVNLEELSFRQTIITVHLVGYSISLVALIISLGILTYFKWIVLFSHPADFTPVCTTELGRIAVHEPLFKKRNVKLLAHSCDNLISHVNWVNDIKSYCRDIPGDFPYPIIADPKRELAVLLNMMDSKRITNIEHQLSIRALYIIDPNHVLRLSMHYPQSTGRNVDETLRVIDSLQLVDRLPQVATPANWVPGEKVMILPDVSDEEANKLFAGKIDKVTMPSGISYVRTTTNYK